MSRRGKYKRQRALEDIFALIKVVTDPSSTAGERLAAYVGVVDHCAPQHIIDMLRAAEAKHLGYFSEVSP